MFGVAGYLNLVVGQRNRRTPLDRPLHLDTENLVAPCCPKVIGLNRSNIFYLVALALEVLGCHFDSVLFRGKFHGGVGLAARLTAS